MYLNRERVSKTLTIAIVEMVISFLITPGSLLFVAGTLAAADNGREMAMVLLFLLPPLIAGIVFFIFSIKRFFLYGAATFCNKVFEGDPDGEVEMDNILSRKGKSRGSAYEQRIEKLIMKDYFRNLTYDKKNRYFELSDKIKNMADYKRRFIGINCPGCAAPLKIRKGTTITCEKCGAKVKEG